MIEPIVAEQYFDKFILLNLYCTPNISAILRDTHVDFFRGCMSLQHIHEVWKDERVVFISKDSKQRGNSPKILYQ